MRLVKPNWSAEMRFPQRIRVLKPIATEALGSGVHEILINRPDQEIPALVIQWMQGDPRYRTWFLSEQSAPKTLPAEDESVEQVADDVEPVDDKPKRGRRKKAAEDGDE